MASFFFRARVRYADRSFFTSATLAKRMLISSQHYSYFRRRGTGQVWPLCASAIVQPSRLRNLLLRHFRDFFREAVGRSHRVAAREAHDHLAVHVLLEDYVSARGVGELDRGLDLRLARPEANHVALHLAALL